MRDNGRPPILVSTLAPGTYSLAGEMRTVVCACGTWRRVRRGMVWPHDDERGARCAGSAQRVWWDLDAQQEAAGRFTLELAGQHAAQRRGARTHVKPVLAAPPPLARMAREREQSLTWTRRAERAEVEARYWEAQAEQSSEATRRQACREQARSRRSDAAYWRSQLQRPAETSPRTT